MPKQQFFQTRIAGEARQWRHGAIAFPGRHPAVRGYRNLSGAVQQQQTLTVDTYTGSATYAWQVTLSDGTIVTFSYVENGDVNETGVASKVAAKLNAHPDVRKAGKAESAAGVVTLTSVQGIDLKLETSDSKMTAVETVAPADAGDIPMGCLVLRDGSENGEPKGKLAAPMSTAQSLVVTHGETGEAQIVLKVDGKQIIAKDSTAADLKTALDAMLPATGFDVSVVGADLTIAVDVAGDSFDLIELTGDAVVKSNTRGDRIADKFAGVTIHHELSTSSVGAMGGNKADVLEEDCIALNIPGVEDDAALFVGTAGDEQGVIYAERAAGRVYCGDCLLVQEVTSDNKFAVAKIK